MWSMASWDGKFVVRIKKKERNKNRENKDMTHKITKKSKSSSPIPTDISENKPSISGISNLSDAPLR